MDRHDQRIVLEAFSRDFNRELHNLRERPDILWQQLYNHLQWADGEEGEGPVSTVIAPEFKRRIAPGASPWLHLLNQTLESEALLRTLKGHTDRVWSCCYSPDGKLIVSASGDCTLKLWEVETGKEIRTLRGHTNKIISCAFSPDRKLIVSASDDCTLKFWETDTGKEIRTIKGYTNPFYSCSFSPDGKLIVSASADRTLKLWEADTSKWIRTFKGHTNQITSCNFSPDGKLIVSASADRTLKLWDADTGKEIRTLKGHTDYVMFCGFSPDGKLIASASADHTLKLWDVDTGKEIRFCKGHTDWVRSCGFSPDGKLILSASADRTLKLWEVDTGKEIRTLEGHIDWVLSCGFSPDGKLIVSAGWDRTLILWEMAGGGYVGLFPVLGEAYSIVFSPRGTMVACGDSGGNLYILRFASFPLTQPVTVLSDSDSVSIVSPNILSRKTVFLSEAASASHVVDKSEVRYFWHILALTFLPPSLFLAGYALTLISIWLWLVTVPLHLACVYFSVVLVRQCANVWHQWGYFWRLIIRATLPISLFLAGYFLTQLSPWLWLAALPLFTIGVYILWLIISARHFPCPYCHYTNYVFRIRGKERCKNCKEKFYIL